MRKAWPSQRPFENHLLFEQGLEFRSGLIFLGQGCISKGVWSRFLGIATAEQCIDVDPGYWAPTGSSLPEPCPGSGCGCMASNSAHKHHGILACPAECS